MHNCSSSLTKETCQFQTATLPEAQQQSQLVNALVDGTMRADNSQNLPADAIRAISMIGSTSEQDCDGKHFPIPYSRGDSLSLARERWVREGHADKLHEPRRRRASVHHPTGLHAFKHVVIQHLRRASYSETGSASHHHSWQKHAGHSETQARRCSAEVLPPVTSAGAETKKGLSLLIQRFKTKLNHSPATSAPASPSRSSITQHAGKGFGLSEPAVVVRSSHSTSAIVCKADHSSSKTPGCGVVSAFLHPSACGSLHTESMRLEHEPKHVSPLNSTIPQTSGYILPGTVNPCVEDSSC